ncbi:MAG TPA: GGDEF domain-containing protein [Solirubrobacteraceae bacterium]|nr:GGDEF domain-containing protein [Solirubrobacteraceae bacterium]
MTRRLLPAGVAITILCLPISVLLALRVGIVPLVPYVVAGTVVVLMGTLFSSKARAEYWLFAGDFVTLFAIAAVVALTGGSESPVLGFLAFALVAGAGRHTPRALVLFAVLTVVAAALACALATNRGVDYTDLRFAGGLTTIVGLAILVFTLTGAEREYREQSLVDPLTGVLNRLALTRRLEELRAQAAVGEGRLCVIAGDVDHFKEINDTHGHDAGDAVLREIASALRTNLRAFPLLYRTGGEEFVAVLPGLSRGEGEQIAQRLRGVIERTCPNDIRVTMSFGVASSAGLGLDPDAVLTVADRCLYQAKEGGRNRVVTHAETDAVAWGDAEQRSRLELPLYSGEVWA